VSKKTFNRTDLAFEEKEHHLFKKTKKEHSKKMLKNLERAIKNKDYSKLMNEDLY